MAEPAVDRLWLGYLAVGAALAACCLATPRGGDWLLSGLAAYALVGLLTTAAVLVRTRRHRPSARWPWLLIAASLLVSLGADIACYHARHAAEPTADPAALDALYLARYLLLAAGLLMIRQGRAAAGDPSSLLDSLAVAMAGGTVSFLYLIEPRLGADPSPLTMAFALGYPAAGLLLLTVGCRLLAAGAARQPPALLLLAGHLAALLAADACHLAARLGPASTVSVPDRLLDGLRLAGFLALGAAVLHPTTRQVSDPGGRAGGAAELGRVRLVTLYVAGMIPPGALAMRSGQADRFTVLVAVAATAVTMTLIVLRLRQAESRQRQLAVTDALTGLYTRRFLETQLPLVAARSARAGRACRGSPGLALLLVDVDHFKSINDRYGHPAGDRALAEVAGRLRAAARSGDVVARYGGEEFALLAPGVGREELRAFGERLRAAVSADPVPVADGVWLTVTVSVGAAASPRPTADLTDLVDLADRALYAAKAAGRDRVVVANGDPGAGAPAAAVLPAAPAVATRASAVRNWEPRTMLPAQGVSPLPVALPATRASGPAWRPAAAGASRWLPRVD